LASDAKIRDGLVYVIGGFPDSWTVPSLPATSRLTLVTVFDLRAGEGSDDSHDLGVEMWHDGSGERVATAHVTFAETHACDVGAPKFRSVVIPFIVDLHHVGPHEVRLTKYAKPIASVPFAVRVA
jgi:hypothetical protein